MITHHQSRGRERTLSGGTTTIIIIQRKEGGDYLLETGAWLL